MSAMTFLDLIAVVLFALVCILATVLGLNLAVPSLHEVRLVLTSQEVPWN